MSYTDKPNEVISALEHAGFVRARQRGSHPRLKRGILAVTVPIHPGDVRPNAIHSILRQAQLTEEEFLALL